MALFKAMAPKVEVNGQTVLSVVDGMGTFKNKALEILKKNGIDSPAPDKWYPQQAWLDAFKEISQSVGANTLRQIGKSIPKNAKFPPQIDSIEKALSSIDVAYHMNHRGGEIGNYGCSPSGPTSAKLVCKNPFPCDFDQGIIDAMASRFAPPGKTPCVMHDDAQPCRKKGADSCTYTVTW